MSRTKNTGKSAEKAFLKLIKPAVVERFWDQSDLRGINGGRAVGDFPKPSDFIVTKDGSIHYAEVKSVQGKVSFPFSNIQKAQNSSALRQAAVGGDYRFYIYSFGLEQWFLLPAKQYAALVGAKQKSVKFKDLQIWK